MEEQMRDEVRRLRRAVRWLGAGSIGVVSLFLVAATALPQNENLRVRSLTVVDERGVERVIIGAPVPDPVSRGSRQPRAGAISGIILNGPDGNERGGYGTTDVGGEALLTLDGAEGGEVFKVVANPDAGASLFVMHRNGAGARLTTFRGSPEFELIDANRRRVHAIPESMPPTR
ncbi:hypothetical protein [Sphingosinicella sp. CPCC 101087]|uniref:hypothetical protein n=1 Tax=Sphingosinicella sp. CPCC 101087 TaxID=2497754 RepID=UPI00197FA531|nr:hypothetical protein [Sphingosinicella sp. CPCC 101087]